MQIRTPNLLFLLFLCSCQVNQAPDNPPSPEPAAVDDALAYNRFWQIGTHNSFWVPHRGGDPYASGPRERLLDQLLADHARSLELDIHQSEKPHAFRIYHSVPKDSLCDTMEECLGLVRTFHRTLPEHQPLLLIIELKELFGPLFDDDHTPEDFDRALEAELGPILYRPADFQRRCDDTGDSHITLEACARKQGWPTLQELSGRVLVAVLGNWDMFGGQNTTEWVHYSMVEDIRQRAAFPMASAWMLDWAKLDEDVRQRISAEELARAASQSIFLQSESLGDELALRFAKAQGVVRMDNVFTAPEQKQAAEAGLHIFQTDTPWIAYDDYGPEMPLRSLLPKPTGKKPQEPGRRLRLESATAPDERVFAYTETAMGTVTDWESTISSGVQPTDIGCLRGASALGSGEASSVTLCRRVLADKEGPLAVASAVSLQICQNGSCSTQEWTTEDCTKGGPGEILALRIRLEEKRSCITAQSARLVDRALAPIFSPLGGERCVDAPLIYQGLALAQPSAPHQSNGRAVYFFNTTRNGSPVSGSQLTGVSVESNLGIPASNDRTRLKDISFPN